MPTTQSTPFAWAELVLDRFAGVANATLAAHVPDYGAAWTNGAGYVCKLDGAGGVWSNGSDLGTDPTPQALTAISPAAGQFAQCVVHQLDVDGGAAGAGLVARWTDVANTYGLWYRSDFNLVMVQKLVASVSTLLHTEALELNDGEGAGLQLFVVGTEVTAVLNGVVIFQDVDASLAGPGRCGLITNADYASGLSHGIHVHSFLAGSLG